MVPQGYCLEKGKIVPDSIFFSDKTILKGANKTKITKVHIWSNQEDIPNMIQFVYEDEEGEKIEGIQPIQPVPSSLEYNVFRLKEKDYIYKIKTFFKRGQLLGVHLISKFGKEMKIESELARTEGELFVFEPRPNQIPSLAFGAYIKKS